MEAEWSGNVQVLAVCTGIITIAQVNKEEYIYIYNVI